MPLGLLTKNINTIPIDSLGHVSFMAMLYLTYPVSHLGASRGENLGLGGRGEGFYEWSDYIDELFLCECFGDQQFHPLTQGGFPIWNCEFVAISQQEHH